MHNPDTQKSSHYPFLLLLKSVFIFFSGVPNKVSATVSDQNIAGASTHFYCIPLNGNLIGLKSVEWLKNGVKLDRKSSFFYSIVK